MSEFVTSTELTDAHARRIASVHESLRTVPALRDRYAGGPAPTTLAELETVPRMDKNDLQAALAHLQPRARTGATWIFQSGGSTGAPQVGHAPTGLYMDRVYAHWKALTPDDVFVNGWSAGKMWGAHFLVNSYVDHAGCVAMNLGAMAKEEYDPWLEFFASRHVTAYGGTPSVLRLVFGHARAAGIKLPELRKVLYLGEAWDPALDEDLAIVAPNAGRWGMFGSTETWVVATNTPDCPADTFHPIPSQLVHVGDDELLDFTCLADDVLNPVLRYQTGDAGRVVTCTCGDPGPAYQVLGRRDNLVKFRGHLVNIPDLVADVSAHPGVARAQVVLHEPADGGAVLEVLLLTHSGAADGVADAVRERIVGAAFGPSIVFQRNPQALAVRVVDALHGNDRTGKIPDLVRR